MQALLIFTVLAVLKSLDAKNTGVLKASQDIEGFQNTTPNVVMQSVVLGKKKRSRDEEEVEDEESGEELIGKLGEFFLRENLDEEEEIRSLDLLRRMISRVQYRRLNRYPDDFEFVEPKYERRHRRRRPIFEGCESDEEPPKRRNSEESERYKKRRKTRYRNPECFECKVPREGKPCAKKRKRLIKKDEEDDPKGPTPDILYIPKFDYSD